MDDKVTIRLTFEQIGNITWRVATAVDKQGNPLTPPPSPWDTEFECCPDCGGEGAVLSDRPGYLQICPTCKGEGEVEVTPHA